MSPEHKLLDLAQHLGVYIGGAFTLISVGVGVWWRERQKLRKIVADNVIIVAWIREHMATQDDLRDCRHGVDEQDANNLKVVLDEVRKGELRNEEKHDAILADMNALHQKTMNTLLDLHSNTNK